jgi:hypothetical protein
MLRIKNEVLLSGVDNSTAKNTAAVDLENMLGYAIQCIFTGSPMGTIKLQGSNDFNSDANFNVGTFAPTNWTDISGASSDITTAGSVLFNANGAYYRWVRAVWTPGSSSGALTVELNSKGF